VTAEPTSLRLTRGLVGRLVRTRSALVPARLPTSDRDVPLDPDVFAFLGLMESFSKFHPAAALGRVRREYETMGVALDVPRRPIGHVEDFDLSLPGRTVRARAYLPRERRQNGPGLVWVHGGGWVIGSLDSHDRPCREIADDAACVVVSVDYRLAPEHAYPAAADDATAAFRWVVANAAALGIDPARIAVAGDSAGGNLATVVCLDTRDDAVRPCFQLLIYPATDLTRSFPSHRTLGKGYFLESETMDWFIDRYTPDPSVHREPRASPFHAKSLAGLPPAFVQTAGFDPLRDEGQAYADKLAEAGVSVQHRCYGGLIHGYLNMSGTVVAARAPIRDAVIALRRAFAGPR
jgi:acetyl esterase